jgi:hypothetical protein
MDTKVVLRMDTKVVLRILLLFPQNPCALELGGAGIELQPNSRYELANTLRTAGKKRTREEMRREEMRSEYGGDACQY